MAGAHETRKKRNPDDPLPECPLMCEYIAQLFVLIGKCHMAAKYEKFSDIGEVLEGMEQILEEMSEGYWAICESE